MSGRTPARAVRALPERPSLEHLKKQARRRLRELQQASPTCKLADVHLQIARDHGFPSWRAMKVFIESGGGSIGVAANLVGSYRHDPRAMTNGLVTVSDEGGRLFIEMLSGGRFELSEDGPGQLVVAGLEGSYSFEGTDAGQVTALIAHGAAGETRLERVDEAEARTIRLARQQAVALQSGRRTQVPVAPEVLQRYTGHYVTPLGVGLEVVSSDGRLLVQVFGQPQVEVYPESETRFFYRIIPAQLEFVSAGGDVTAVVLHQNGIEQRLDRVSADEARRISTWLQERLSKQQQPRALTRVDPVVLDRYAGRYQIDAGRVVTVAAEQGRLFVELTDQPRFEVFPESEHTFFWTVVAAQISFVTAPGGRVTHAVLHQSGRNFPMPRLDDQGAAP